MNRISFDFTGTTTVITGGSSGIGLATAELIARSGGDVIVSASRKEEKTKTALEKIHAAKLVSNNPSGQVEALPYQADNEDSVRDFFEKIAGYNKRIDFVIDCVAVSIDKKYDNQDGAFWKMVLSNNIVGTALLAKYASLLMRTQDIVDEVRGKIVLVTSTNGIDSYGIFSAPYDASKAATNNMVRNLGEHFHREHQIIVNGLAPGWIDTSLNDTLPEDARAEESAKIWSGRFGEPEEMAAHAAALLTLPYMSGRIVMADGGYR